jgi:hypothetical protein
LPARPPVTTSSPFIRSTARHGPTSGALEHVLDDLIKIDFAEISERNLIAQTTFHQPICSYGK